MLALADSILLTLPTLIEYRSTLILESLTLIFLEGTVSFNSPSSFLMTLVSSFLESVVISIFDIVELATLGNLKSALTGPPGLMNSCVNLITATES